MDQYSEHQFAQAHKLIGEIEHHLLPEADGQFIRCENYRVFRAYFKARILYLKSALLTATVPHIHHQQQVKTPNRPKENQNRTDETVKSEV